MNRTTGLVAGAVVAAVGVAAVGVWLVGGPGVAHTAASDPPDPPKPPANRDQFAEDRVPARTDFKAVPFDGDRAMKDLKELCDLGPRVSGSDGMAKQQALLTKHFETHGGKVARQEFKARQRSQRADVAMANLVASWHPDRPKRVVLCSHYDTRPAAHEEPDRQNWSKPFASANDGTSGVAILMELARHLTDIPTGVGVDLVLFDGEEYILDPGVPYVREGDRYFLGSEHFAAEYTKARGKLPYQYRAAILLDLCGHEGARLAIEGYSSQWAPELVADVWKVAAAVGAKSFKMERGFDRAFQVQDDHLPLNQAGIPAIDVIDFDYKHWHRLTDTPDKCSAGQLAEVGKVLGAWLQTLK